jgi:hypothetical protein
LAAYRGWTVYSSRGAWIEFYAEGFIVSRAGSIVTARWDEITSLRERLFYVPLRARAIRMSYHITLANGQVARIDHAFGQMNELGKTLQRMTTAALLPAARDTYERGEPVRFGRFSVTQWGITDHDHKQENGMNGHGQTLLWRDLRRISFARGVLTISRGGARGPWARARVADVPNIYLLTTLISYVPRS